MALSITNVHAFYRRSQLRTHARLDATQRNATQWLAHQRSIFHSLQLIAVDERCALQLRVKARRISLE